MKKKDPKDKVTRITYSLRPEIVSKLQDIYINKLKYVKSVSRSAIIAEAIALLWQKEAIKENKRSVYKHRSL